MRAIRIIHRPQGRAISVLIGLLLIVVLSVSARVSQAVATAPDLGTAETFAVVAYSTVTNTGPTIVTGDLGVSPLLAGVGFDEPGGPGTVVGTQYKGDAVAAQAKADAGTAYNFLAAQGVPTTACDFNYGLVADIGGDTLTPGIHCFPSSAAITGPLPLTLDAQGDPNAVWVFNIESTLVTGPNASVVLTNSGDSCNVFWRVGSSATLDTYSQIVGTIIAYADIDALTGATVDGRLFALNAAVDMDTNIVTAPTNCGVEPPQPGTIRIIKDDAIDSDTVFDFEHNISRPNTFSLQDPSDTTVEIFEVPAGNYTVTELDEQGWTLTEINCRENGDQDTTTNLQTGAASISVQEGETVQCTFVNAPNPGEVTIIKAATPKDDTEFDFTHSGPGSFTLQDPSNDRIVFSGVAPGQYTVTELEEQGWTLTGVRCTDGNSTGDVQSRTATINVEPGETLSCTFVNVKQSIASFCPVDPNVGNELTDLLGTGQGGTNKGFRTRKLVVPNYQNAVALYGQLAAVERGQMRYVRFRYPDNSYITIHNPTSFAYRAYAVNWWGADLDPSPFIKGQFFWGKNGDKSPRAFVLWPTYSTVEEYANVFETFDESIENHVYWDEPNNWIQEQIQTLDIPETQAAGAVLTVKVAIVDNNSDGRPVVLTVEAGGVSQEVVAYGPNRKDTLNIEEIVLTGLPEGTDQVVITLYSPGPFDGTYGTGVDGGDSAAMIGVAISYPCVMPAR